MKPEAYIVNLSGTFIDAVPVKVVRETKSTIVVRAIGRDYDRTFQKRKIYGEDRYENPRELDGPEYGFRNMIDERGYSGYGGYHLTFDIERVEARLESEKGQKAIRDRYRTMETRLEQWLNKSKPLDAALAEKLTKLEEIFPE